MNRNEILQELEMIRKIGISKTDWFVCYGAALVLWGIKEDTHDIDLSGNKKAFMLLETRGYKVENYPNLPGVKYIKLSDKTDMFDMNTMTLPAAIVLHEGFYVQTPESVLVEKLARNREKDQKDVVLIRKWLEENR